MIPVYELMSKEDTYDIVLISMIANWIAILEKRNAGNLYRTSRLSTMQELLLGKIEPSYKGSIPEEFQNVAEKYMGWIEKDLNTMLKAIKETKK